MANQDGYLKRGKLGPDVYYVVNGKQRVRMWVPVFNPQTPRQMEIRSINTELSRYWRDELNQGQRIAWEQRAEVLETRGERLFIKQNFQLLDFGLPIQMTPPPMVMPPELTDLVETPDTERLEVEVPQMTPGTITAQTPFLDVEVAGGFTSAAIIDNSFYHAEMLTEALSQGRKHLNSDFRHVFYLADKPITEPVEISLIQGNTPDSTIRNVVFRIRRFNKYGHSSGVLIFNKIVQD